MKKVFTLAAGALMAAGSFKAQAQIAVDGVLTAAEIGAANTGKYVLLGKFTSPRGFGDWGLLSLYAANSATKVYFFVGGTVENGTNAFQLFLDLPNVTGASASPASLPVPTPASTSFGGMVAKMDIAPDLALAIKGNGSGPGGAAGTVTSQAVVYTSPTAASDKDLVDLPNSGAATTVPATAAIGTFIRLAGARMAYKNSSDGKILTNPGNVLPNTSPNYGAAGSFGWEIELDRTALGVTVPGSIGVFALQNNGGGDYLSSDFIPQSTNPPTANGGNLANANMVDFAAIPGTQRAAFNVVTLGTKAADDASVAMSVYPNPAAGTATVAYNVQNANEQVNVVLTDLMGRQVRVLANGQMRSGTQLVNLSSDTIAAGTYLVRVQVGDRVATRKVVLL